MKTVLNGGIDRKRWGNTEGDYIAKARLLFIVTLKTANKQQHYSAVFAQRYIALLPCCRRKERQHLPYRVDGETVAELVPLPAQGQPGRKGKGRGEAEQPGDL